MPNGPINADNFDVVLVADTGNLFVVKMQKVAGGHEPIAVSTLDPSQHGLPSLLRDTGTTVAVMPSIPSSQDGCTCYLLNLQSIKDSLHPPPDFNMLALARTNSALRAGGKLTLSTEKGEETVSGLKPRARRARPVEKKAKVKRKVK